LKKIIILIILLTTVSLFCQSDGINFVNNFVDPMIVHWNEILFLECTGFGWWQITIKEKCSIINAVVSSMKYYEEIYDLETKIEYPEIKEHFVFSGKGLAIDISIALDAFYKENKKNNKYDIKTIKLILSIYKQWEEGILIKEKIKKVEENNQRPIQE